MKRIRNYPVGTKLEVEWLDTVEDSSWQSDEKARERPDADCLSVGYFLKKDKEFLYLSSTVTKGERSSLAIPTGTIKDIYILIPVPLNVFKITKQPKQPKQEEN